MHRRGGDGVNTQQRNKITPLSGNRPFSADTKRTLQNNGSVI